MAAPPLDAVVLDVDGTLYDPAPVKRGMLLRLARAHALRPVLGWRTMRALSAYRRGQEALRGGPGARGPRDLAALQLAHAAERTGLPVAAIEPLVTEWMERRPLDLVGAARRPGLGAFLAAVRAAGVGVGVFSDYPPEGKLEALGVAASVDVVAWAQQGAVGRFKPDPAGILHVLERLGAAPERSLYVGDRADVDVPAAARAGVRCALVGAGPDAATVGGDPPGGWFAVAGFAELGERLFERLDSAFRAP